MTDNMKEVTEKEMYAFINEQSDKGVDLITTIIGSYPYTTIWQTRYTNNLYAKQVDSYPPDGVYPLVSRYYLITPERTN